VFVPLWYDLFVPFITMRSREILTISLPREMMEQVEATRKAEHRTRSELVREALRTYFALALRFPEVQATPAEIRALARARREFERGDTMSLSQYLNELPPRTRNPGKKAARQAAKSRPHAEKGAPAPVVGSVAGESNFGRGSLKR